MNSENTLIIEPAASWFFIAVVSDGACKYHSVELVAKNNDAWLSIAVNKALAQASMNHAEQILLGAGPGSFTALRIAFSYVKARAWLQKSRISTFSSVDFWQSFFDEDEQVFLLKANRNLYYAHNEAATPAAWVEKLANEAKKITIFENNYPGDNALSAQAERVYEQPPAKSAAEIYRIIKGLELEPTEALFELSPNYVYDLEYRKKEKI